MLTFEFRRYRFHFRALDSVHFPVGKSGNILRGAFGAILHETTGRETFARLFQPGARTGGGEPSGPSGLGDWPRPFLFRTPGLDGQTIPPGGTFSFHVHNFDLREPCLEHFRTVFERLAETGLGPGRGRVELAGVEDSGPLAIPLEPDASPVEQVRVLFATPTELKCDGAVVERPEFPILFARLRDRLSTLRALYGAGPLDIDFRGMGERAARIRMTRCELAWESVERRSSRTGQVHSLGGFTGEAEYAGGLAEFVPWLRAAQWTGVGRHTVWGNGELRVL